MHKLSKFSIGYKYHHGRGLLFYGQPVRAEDKNLESQALKIAPAQTAEGTESLSSIKHKTVRRQRSK